MDIVEETNMNTTITKTEQQHSNCEAPLAKVCVFYHKSLFSIAHAYYQYQNHVIKICMNGNCLQKITLPFRSLNMTQSVGG